MSSTTSTTPLTSDRPLCVPHDTTLEAARVQFDALRRLTPEERLKIGCRMIDEARAFVRAGVRHRHPEYDEEQVRLASIRIFLGEHWFQTCFPGCNVEP